MVLIEDVDDEPTKVKAKPSSEWRRIQVVEADSDDDAEANVEPPKASRPQRVWSDPCPDLEITCTVAGIEDAKSRGNRLYVDGKLAESERWFTKAIWFYESGKVREVPGDLRCALHTNRALARLKLQRFADAEHDCSTVLEEKPENGKARYRRATARFEQGKLVPALEDAKKALLSLPTDSRGEAQEMKAQIEALLVMDRHPKHGGLQNAALFLLRSLVKDSASARQAVSNGAVDRVLAALALCLKGRKVQYSGLVALRYMLEAGYPNRWQDSLKTVRANIQEATLQAKVTHQSDEGIHKVADQVLALVMPRFKEVLCWHFQSGWCRLGPKCTYAHGLEELRSVGRGKASGKGYFRGAFAGGA